MNVSGLSGERRNSGQNPGSLKELHWQFSIISPDGKYLFYTGAKKGRKGIL